MPSFISENRNRKLQGERECTDSQLHAHINIFSHQRRHFNRLNFLRWEWWKETRRPLNISIATWTFIACERRTAGPFRSINSRRDRCPSSNRKVRRAVDAVRRKSQRKCLIRLIREATSTTLGRARPIELRENVPFNLDELVRATPLPRRTRGKTLRVPFSELRE